MKVKAKGVAGRIDAVFDAVRTELARVAAGTDTVLVGPFVGEVGFELLYWIPLIRWAVREHPELNGRLVVISRGGTAEWLAPIDVRYVDLLSLYTPEEFAASRQDLKSREIRDFDRQVLERVQNRLGLSKASIIHPSLLYELYYGLMRVDRHAFVRSVRAAGDGRAEGLGAVYERIPQPDLGPLAGVLPDDFVAARFYFRPSFPDSPDARSFAVSVVQALTRTTSVVMLNNRLEIDDHSDFADLSGERVVWIDELMTPETNLAVQTIAVSRARAFIGTYGGLAYLAPFVDVPALGFIVDPGEASPWHFDLAARVFAVAGMPSVLAIQPQDLPIVDMITRDFAFGASPLPRLS